MFRLLPFLMAKIALPSNSKAAAMDPYTNGGETRLESFIALVVEIILFNAHLFRLTCNKNQLEPLCPARKRRGFAKTIH